MDEQAVFVPLLDRLRDGEPRARPGIPAASADDIADQLAKSLWVMLDNADAAELLQEAADYAFNGVLAHRQELEDLRRRARTPVETLDRAEPPDDLPAP
ncbi:hypothetical protein [Streptomyces abikoensis]